MPFFVIFLVLFYVAACILLGLIFAILAPSLIRAVKRALRQVWARRHRDFRFVIDEEKMDEKADEMEGVYFFE